jgi:hypothetical protein
MTIQKARQPKATFDATSEVNRALVGVNPASAALAVMGKLNREAAEAEGELRSETDRAIVIAFQLSHEGADLTADEQSLLLEELAAVSARRKDLSNRANRLRERAKSYSELADTAPEMSRRSGLRQQDMSG